MIEWKEVNMYWATNTYYTNMNKNTVLGTQHIHGVLKGNTTYFSIITCKLMNNEDPVLYSSLFFWVAYHSNKVRFSYSYY